MEQQPWAVTAAPVVLPPAPPAPPRRLLVRTLLALGVVASVTAFATVDRPGPPPVLLAVEEPAPAADGWAPAYVDDAGRPARWDPCAPVPYVLNPGWAPPTARADLTEALRRLEVASGLRFVDEGETDELPSAERAAYQPDRYGERWAPLLVAWVPVALTDVGLGGDVAGLSRAVAVPGESGGHLVSGQLVLDADSRLAAGFGPGVTQGEVLLHELAHAVGLGHVLDPTQVMYPQTTQSESTYGAGDRAGLAAVGAAAGCHPAPEPRPLRLG